jgi:hypothetical protein
MRPVPVARFIPPHWPGATLAFLSLNFLLLSGTAVENDGDGVRNPVCPWDLGAGRPGNLMRRNEDPRTGESSSAPGMLVHGFGRMANHLVLEVLAG